LVASIQGSPFLQGAPVQLHRVAAAADEHHLGHTGGVGQLAVAEVQPAAVHGVDLDVAADPVRAHALEVAELDVLAGDVAADALADRAVGRLGGQLVELRFADLRVLRQQFVELAAVDRHARVLDADAVRFSASMASSTTWPLLVSASRRQVHLDQLDVEARRDELLEYALEGDLRHFVAVQHHQRLLDLDFLGRSECPGPRKG
jgi:hypothetical protein